MAQGVPIVATQVGGIPETIESGRDGLLVEPGDADALANAMHTVIADAEATNARTASARECFRRRHTLERAGDVLESVYRATARRRS